MGARAQCVLAPNAGPMTLDGTNTWVLLEPGSARAVVVDPGPDDPRHLAAVVAAAAARDAAVVTILLTHGHPDHSEGARSLAALTGSGVRALDPAHRLGPEGLADGEVVDVAGLVIRVVGTPGHTSDSLTFLVPAEGAMLTGDTVLGRGSTLVAYPDGQLGDYLASLQRLADLAAGGAGSVWPGHGPVLDDGPGAIAAYVEHRRVRLAQVKAALVQGAVTAREVVALVYADVPENLWPAAELSVQAQLSYLSSPD